VRKSLTTALGAVALALLAASIPLAGLIHQLSFGNNGGQTIVLAVYVVVGVVVARREPRNPIGWILLTFPLLEAVSSDGGKYAAYRYVLGHHHVPLGPVAVVLQTLYVPAFALFPLVIVLFPDGRLGARRWRLALWVYIGIVACVMAAISGQAVNAVARHKIRLNSTGYVSTPFLTGHAVQAAQLVAAVGIAGILLSFVLHQFVNWRRATGDRRQQYKWLAAGAGIAVASFIGSFLIGLPLVGLVALPLSIGVGILKYRLYDIDRLISRTLSYTIVTGVLVGVYVGLVVVITDVLSFSSPVAVTASTLVAAALFNPLRKRAQHGVDRHFNRRGYDAETTIAAFSARLRDAVDLNTVRADLLGVIGSTVEPTHVSIWIKERTSHEPRQLSDRSVC
jgi:hypothetical protein